MSRVRYLPAFRTIPECRIEWFVDKDLERCRELARDYGSGQVTCDYRETISSVEAAIVALPNHLHKEATLAFLQEGRDVLCEKPIATTSSDGMKMVEASDASGARLAINLIRRRFNSFRIAKRLLDLDMLGNVNEVTCLEGSIFGWPLSSMDLLNRERAGGGILMDIGTHNLDVLRWLLSGEFELVSYQDDSLGGVEANCNLEFKIISEHSAIPCRMILGRTRTLQNEVIISGDKASLEISQDYHNHVLLRTGADIHRVEPSENKERTLQDKDYFAKQVAKFLDKSSNDYVSGREAVKVLSFIENCYKNRHQMVYPWERDQSELTNQTRLSDNGTILVVGASGFLGTRLVEKLVEKGSPVRAAIHRPGAAARLARLPVHFVECDVLNQQQVDRAVDGCGVVVNCTTGSGTGRNIYDVLAKGTSNLLEASVRHHVKKYVHMSSAAVHGFSKKKAVVDEKSRFMFFPGPYERGKIKSEKLVADYAEKIRIVILRPTLIYGPYSYSNWTTGIIERIRDHQESIVSGNGLANLIYVDDVVDAIVCAIEGNDANGKTFIINDDRRKVTWAEYVGAYAEALGISPVISPQYNPDTHRVKEAFSMLHDSANIMLDVMRSPQLLALLAQVPVIVKVGSMVIKGRRRENIEVTVTSSPELTISRPNPKILLKYGGISKQFYKLLTCQSVFSASKSRKLLNFEPSVTLEEGIERSIEWAKWAGYCDTQEAG